MWALCFYLKKTEVDNNIKRKIYRDISGEEVTSVNDDEIVKEVSDFIQQYKDDPEIDNLLSWAYQYANKIVEGNAYSQTQFFTEKYMISYLINHVSKLQDAVKIVDPCVGGGNFLVECLEFICTLDKEEENNFKLKVILNAAKLYGYDIDDNITRIALVNIRLRVLVICIWIAINR